MSLSTFEGMAHADQIIWTYRPTIALWLVDSVETDPDYATDSHCHWRSQKEKEKKSI